MTDLQYLEIVLKTVLNVRTNYKYRPHFVVRSNKSNYRPLAKACAKKGRDGIPETSFASEFVWQSHTSQSRSSRGSVRADKRTCPYETVDIHAETFDIAINAGPAMLLRVHQKFRANSLKTVGGATGGGGCGELLNLELHPFALPRTAQCGSILAYISHSD